MRNHQKKAMKTRHSKNDLAPERGTSMVEYALLIALICVVAYSSASALGNRVRANFVAPYQCLAGSALCGVGSSGGGSGATPPG